MMMVFGQGFDSPQLHFINCSRNFVSISRKIHRPFTSYILLIQYKSSFFVNGLIGNGERNYLHSLIILMLIIFPTL